MPKLVSEITSGSQYTKSQGDRQGQSQDSATRVFRVVLSAPGEVIDPQLACGVSIGSSHPNYSSLVCNSADIRFDGESRMAVLCTFQYQGVNSEVNEDQPPGTEKANWTLSSSLIESPAFTWAERYRDYRWQALGGQLGFAPAENAVGDIYDGVTRLVPIINITITQTQIGPSPLYSLKYVGHVNSDEIKIESLTMKPHTVMFRGLQAQPLVKTWRGSEYRGWECAYEFSYKPNEQKFYARDAGDDQFAEVTEDLGWDIIVPQSGFNVKAFTPAQALAEDDQFGQPLLHTQGTIDLDNGIGLLPDGVQPNDKVRAMVVVHSYDNGGVSQAPSASPVPLNFSGRPRKNTANPKVLVMPYAIQQHMPFVEIFGLRLQ